MPVINSVPDTGHRFAYLGLGGNIGDVKRAFSKALRLINQNSFGPVKCSRLYLSSAWGVTEQPDFLNMAVEISWNENARQLLKMTQRIENEVGRIKAVERLWGPRPIDIDILFMTDLNLSGAVLTVPHPHLHERLFTLRPLLDLLPGDTIIPRYNQTLKRLLETCTDEGEIGTLSEGPWDEWRETELPT